MPRASAMSWEGAPYFRWVKMHKGVRYRVSCAELGATVWTKEATVKLANEWWARKLNELVPQPDAATLVLREVEQVPVATLKEMIERGQAARRLLAEMPFDGSGVDPETVERLIGIGPVEDESRRTELLARVVAPVTESAVPIDRRLRAQADRWAGVLADQARQGTRSADGADNIRIALEHFVRFIGGGCAVEDIDAARWDQWYTHCQAQIVRRDEGVGKEGWSGDYAAKVFSHSTGFMRWLYETEVLDRLPRNVGSKKYRFERPEKEIPTFSGEEVRVLVGAATGQLRLHLLLMLNTGMTQKDIADLRKAQVDLEAGTLTRRRSKTQRKRNTPKVCYKLWPEVVSLLRQYWSKEGEERALVTRTGQRWVWKVMLESGRIKKADNVASNFQHLRKRVGFVGDGKSLKVFRKTSATRLKGKKEYRDLRFYFLGHSPRTVADRSYSAESQALLDEAVTWLHMQYFPPELPSGD